MKTKIFPLATVDSMSATELKVRLENGELSLLKTFGAENLLKEMAPVGVLCRAAIRIIFFLHWLIFPIHWIVHVIIYRKIPKSIYMRRRVARLFVRPFFPDKYVGKVQQISGPIVVGFNHPTLHEILSLIAWALYQFPQKENCFPVNLPWYECLAPCADELRLLGIHIEPLITKSTCNKIEKLCDESPEIMKVVKATRQKLLSHYGSAAGKFAARGDSIFSAPSSTRQATIFPSYEAFRKDEKAEPLPPAMRALSIHIKHEDKSESGFFLPVTIVPPPGYKPKLNLFKRYQIIIGEPIPMATAHELANGKALDHYFLMQLTKQAPKELWYPEP